MKEHDHSSHSEHSHDSSDQPHHHETHNEHEDPAKHQEMKREHAGHESHAEHKGHHDHHAHMVQDFRKRFWISLALTVPVLLLSPMIQEVIGLGTALRFSGDMLISFFLSSVIFFYGGWPFLKGMVGELKKKTPGMMTLIALAITVAYIYSSAVVFGLGEIGRAHV